LCVEEALEKLKLKGFMAADADADDETATEEDEDEQ
jgi:hypothetical protein